MKKYILGLIVTIGLLVLVGCGGTKSKVDVRSEENIYAISAVSGVESILSNNSLITLNSKNKDMEDVEFNDENMDIMLAFLNDKAFKVEVKESDKEEYKFLINITINNDQVFDFYYNESLIKEEIDEEEIEQKYSINGIILNNDIMYTVEGFKEIEIENEENEVEEEFSLDLRISLDENNYTRLKYEVETETEDNKTELEKVFKTHFFKDGKMVKKIHFDFEMEDNDLAIKLQVFEANEIKIYRLKLNDDKESGVIKFFVKGEELINRGEREFIIVTDESGVITYQYK
ncbi:hypothetical protein [Haploplasma modicum]|jgi:hypothetical protein|uniref:hypothetical protein n=1 Tax=Haploplasma modicum TaxID=2150 RepID=UPI00214AA026|nr:hypothetical protein [Haploplasma modicum]MCR1809195.1 hypothetical protein [Haploplasma modicum]